MGRNITIQEELRWQADRIAELETTLDDTRLKHESETTKLNKRIAELESDRNTFWAKMVWQKTEIERLQEVATHAQALLDGGGDEALHHLRKALAALEKDSNLLCKKHNRCRLDDGRCMECEAALEEDKDE